MPRPKAPAEQQLRAYQLYTLMGYGTSAIAVQLDQEFGNTAVSKRTIANWVSQFKQILPSTKSLDEPFEWHKLDEYDLPWEAGKLLMEMWAFVRETDPVESLIRVGQYLSANDSDTQVPYIAWPTDPPTIRQARWWWRIHLVAPGMREDDLYWLAQGFVVRELARDVLGVAVKFDDLEAHLAFRPWENSSRLSAYMDAVDNSLIPRRHKYGFSYDQLQIIYRTELWDDDYSLMLDSGDTDYILSPSQSLRLHVNESKD